MISEYPAEDRRYDGSEYEPFWAAAAALDMPLSLHTATRRQGKIRGAGEMALFTAAARFQSWLADTWAYAETPIALAALSRRPHQARSFRLQNFGFGR